PIALQGLLAGLEEGVRALGETGEAGNPETEVVLVRVRVRPRVAVGGDGVGDAGEVQAAVVPGEFAAVGSEDDQSLAVAAEDGDVLAGEPLPAPFADELDMRIVQAEHQLLVLGD